MYGKGDRKKEEEKHGGRWTLIHAMQNESNNRKNPEYSKIPKKNAVSLLQIPFTISMSHEFVGQRRNYPTRYDQHRTRQQVRLQGFVLLDNRI